MKIAVSKPCSFSIKLSFASLARCSHPHCLDTFVVGWRDWRLSEGLQMLTSRPAFSPFKLHSVKARHTARSCRRNCRSLF